MVAINRGDNTGAFGYDFLRIHLNNPNNLYIQKAVFQINHELEKEYINPKFPLRINFTGQETELLHQVNHCKLALWDESGRRRTADGKFTFFVKENHINAPDEPVDDYEDVMEGEDNDLYFNLDDAEFAAQFTINAAPSKMSELEQDIPLMTADNIIDGQNIHTFVDENNNIVIEAFNDIKVLWEDVENKPTINGKPLQGNVEIKLEDEIPQADWAATSGPSQILNKPDLAGVAYTGLYSDLTAKPDIPFKTSQLENDAKFITKSVKNLDNYYTKDQVKAEIQSGDYIKPINDKLDALQELHEQDTTRIDALVEEKLDKTVFEEAIREKADYDYVEDSLNKKLDKTSLGKGNLTVSKNDQVLGKFNANSNKDVDINIEVPTKVSQLENDEQFIKQEDLDLDSLVNKEQYEQDKKDFVTNDDLGTGILTIKSNNATLGSFNANSTKNKTVDINVPENLSDLNIDIDLLVKDDLKPIQSDITALQGDVDTLYPQINSVKKQLDNKVDVEFGKQLMSTKEIERLSKLTDYDDTQIKQDLQDQKDLLDTLNNELNQKVDKQIGKDLSTNDFTDQDKQNLDFAYDTCNTLDSQVNKLNKQVETNKNNIATNITNISDTNQRLDDEQTQRQQSDIDLQQQIDALSAKSTVADVVATIQDLENYDTSTLKSKDVISVLLDETKSDATSYYRWNGASFFWIGSEASSFTKAQAREEFVSKTTQVNGHKLSKDITLTAQDVKALPEDTIIGDGTVTIQRNRESIGTFTLNQKENKAINIEVADKLSDLENDEDFINLDTLKKYIGDVTTDNRLQDQVDALREAQKEANTEIESIRGLAIGEIKALPMAAQTGKYSDLIGLPTVISDLKKNNKQDPNNTNYIDDVFLNELIEKAGFITTVEVQDTYAKAEEIPTKLSEFENDRGYVTNTAIGRGILTVTINEETFDDNTWMANEKDPKVINIPVDNELKDSKLPVANNVVTNELHRIDTSVVHLKGNETITDTKTFENIVADDIKVQNIAITNGTSTTMPDADNSTNVATTQFVKNQDYCTNTKAVHKDQNETITGDKTFTGAVVLNAANGITMAQADNSTKLATTAYVKSQDYATNSEAVHKSGDETIQGDKTFNDTTTFVGITNLGRFAHVKTPDKTDVTNFYTDLVTNVEYVDTEISKVNTTIGNNKTDIEGKLNNTKTELQNNINSVIADLGTLNTDYTSFTGTVVSNSDFNTFKSTLETRLQSIENRLTAIETTLLLLKPEEETTD